MSSDEVTVKKEIAQGHGLSAEKQAMIKKCLAREPNSTELVMFAAMWSANFPLKSLEPTLELLSAKIKQASKGAGESAGVVDIGAGLSAVFRIESRSLAEIDPYAAAAAGAGQCIRGIVSVGAAPVGLMYFLRLGNLENEQVKLLLKGVAGGFTDYLNVVGLPVLGGDICFDDSYTVKPLLNVMAVGIVKNKEMISLDPNSVNNLAIMAGGATGRDALGCWVTSDEVSARRKPAVAAADPYMGRILKEVCVELIRKGLVLKAQDIGRAGLTRAICQAISTKGGGLEIDIACVRRKEKGMNAYEVMLSESEERMLFIVDNKKLSEVKKVFSQCRVPADVIGRVTDDGVVCVKENCRIVAKIPIAALVEVPFDKPAEKKPVYFKEANILNLSRIKEPSDYNQILLQLLRTPSIASKAWASKYADVKLAADVLSSGPGSLAVIVALADTKKALAAIMACDFAYCYLDPLDGAKIAVAQAARNLVCLGAMPVGVTVGISLSSPENPEVFWQFKQEALGVSAACSALNIPAVSNNVSFGCDTAKGLVDSSAVVGMIGLINDKSKITAEYFKNEGDLILLVGKNKEELGASQYLVSVHGRNQGKPPAIDLRMEKRVQATLRQAIEKGLVESACAPSKGGLAVALAKICISNPHKLLGAKINTGKLRMRKDALLFAETQSRIIVSASLENANKILAIAAKNKAPASIIGEVAGESLVIGDLIDLPAADLRKTWQEAIENRLKE